jgi:hypothetical protein
MFSVCLVIEDREPEWYNQWGYVLSHWKPEFLYLIGEEINVAYKPFRQGILVQSAEEINHGPLVLLQPQVAKITLPNESLVPFVHPASCVYMFGADRQDFSSVFLGNRQPDNIVYIPTEGDMEMYSWVAGAVTMYDRLLKSHG